MAGEASAQREKQDRSIKARKSELFVEEQVETGPRKRLRDYVKETPAAPLSRNVKMMLGASAAPVLLMFVAALLAPSRSKPKPPAELIIPARVTTAPSAIARGTGGQPSNPAAEARKSQEPGRGDQASGAKPPQDKEKAKPKKKPKKSKAKPKTDDTAVAVQGDKPRDDGAEGKEKDKAAEDKDQDKAGDSKKKPGSASASSDAKSKAATTTTTPKKRAAPIFKPKKPEIRTYPKREGEKKAETTPDADAGAGLP
jgi:hypothetical protein